MATKDKQTKDLTEKPNKVATKPTVNALFRIVGITPLLMNHPASMGGSEKKATAEETK